MSAAPTTAEANILACYEELVAVTERMCAAALADAWDELDGLEGERARLVQALQRLDRVAGPTDVYLAEKRRLLVRANELDQAVRERCDDQRTSLERALGAIPAHKRAARAYDDNR